MNQPKQAEHGFYDQYKASASRNVRPASWLGKDDFKACVREWADKLGVKTHSLSMRPMRHKWASCSTAGRLTFNVELLQLDRELGNYVIVHELLHFFVPNHGRLWKSLMRAYLGEYESVSRRLPARHDLARIEQTD